MNRSRILILLAIAIIVLLVTILAVTQHKRHQTTATLGGISALPRDVEQVLEDYAYREDKNGMKVAIKGRQAVLRGKNVLGLRSNVVKATYFTDMQGSIRTATGTVAFSASDAIWDPLSGAPLALNRNVAVSLNGRPLHPVTSARIFLCERVLEISADRITRQSF